MFIHFGLSLWAFFILLIKLDDVLLADRRKLWNKSLHLYLVFIAFTDRSRPYRQLKQAMICAIVSAVYDYDSDWENGDRGGKNTKILLNQYVAPELHRLAMDLFRLDVGDELSLDGLERGSVAFLFYWRMIQPVWMKVYSQAQIELFGRRLQIVDDLLDLEQDQANGDKNCFLLPGSGTYVDELVEFLGSEFFQALKANHWVYRKLEFKLREKLTTLGAK